MEQVVAAQHGSAQLDSRFEVNVLYAQGWALVHMLSLSEEFQPKFGELLQTILGGVDPAGAFELIYGLSLPEVEERLRAYLRLAMFNGAEFQIRIDRAAKPTMEPAPASEIEPILQRLRDPFGGDGSQTPLAPRENVARFVNAVGLQLEGVRLRPANPAAACLSVSGRREALQPPRVIR
jgi:hypothetical protein